MPVNLIRDADIHAISIVGKGANRKRFFLRKADADASETLSTGRLVKAEDWSAVYCVVAEPGWHENSGIGGPDVEDRWADEAEIRKAAHRFMANGGLVNKMHESLEPYGQLVENAVALADFTVDGETIRKGSWYIAITPSEEGKASIEKGEFTGVSIEGLAVRELVEKDAALVPNKPGKTNWVQEAGGLPKFIADIAGDLISEKGKSTNNAIQMAVGIAKNWCGGKGKVTAKTRAKACKAVAEWEAKKAKAHLSKSELGEIGALTTDTHLIAKAEGSTPDAPTVGAVDKTLLQKIAEKVGLKPEEIEAINKADRTFGEIIAQRDFDKALPEAFSAFRDAVSYAFFPPPDSEGDPVALISESCDEFKAWALDMLDKVPVEKAERAEALGVELDPEGSTQPASTKDGDMALTEQENARLEKIEQAVADLDPDTISKAFATNLAKALGAPAEDETPTAESIAKRAKDLAGVTDEAELAKKVDKIQADIAKLAEGGTTQPIAGNEEPVSKEANREAIEKAFKREGVNPTLAGVLGG